ncbi:MAG TPA: type 1 glutamine amidotransferase domain-containing protein [Actinomycetota bacterium]|nr:type 1 glutamine amidotransferase domain-containing protein [Actinomycetota bacterium]
MARTDLSGKRIACLATHGVEQVELTEPRKALEEAGAHVDLVSMELGQIQGVDGMDKADVLHVDRAVRDVSVDDYDALLIPGGVANPDKMRTNDDAVGLVRSFVGSGKPVAAICHGPWMLVEADVLRDRVITSWPSLETDVRNAGATWVNEEVHVDEGIVTSRKPDDIPAFNAKMIEAFAQGTHQQRRAS